MSNSSAMTSEEKKNLLNHPIERKKAAELHWLNLDFQRPNSKSSSKSLEQEEKKNKANEIVISQAAVDGVEDIEIPDDVIAKETWPVRVPIKMHAAESHNLGRFKNTKDLLYRNIWDLLDIKSQSVFTQACKGTARLFQSDMEREKLSKLLKHVLYGEKEEIGAMLEKEYKRDPKQLTFLRPLLLKQSRAKTPYGQTIEGTALYMALAGDDKSRADHPDEGIAEVIESYLRMFPEGKAEIAQSKAKAEYKHLESIEAEEKFYQDFFQPLVNAIANERFLGKEHYQYYFFIRTTPPTLNTLDSLPLFENQAAYVRCGDDLYFVDKTKNECKKITIKYLNHFNYEFNYKTRLADGQQISAADLIKIQDFVRHFLVNDATERALKNFRRDLIEKFQIYGVVKAGKYGAGRLLEKAIHKYAENYLDFGNYMSFKNQLFWRQVVGYIQRYLPANYAQAICQGLYSMGYENKKLERSLLLKNRDLFYYSLSSSGLGDEYAISTFGYKSDAWQISDYGYKNYFKQKHQPDRKESVRCLVM
ncbi:MAG: hypothetical protein ACYCQI_07445 [Gammaproteobacteria bacterium]